MNTNSLPPEDDSQAIAAFERLRGEAESQGIAQDMPLSASTLAALGDMAPAPITVGQLKALAAGADRALQLARAAAERYTRDDDASHVDPIVSELEELVRQFERS